MKIDYVVRWTVNGEIKESNRLGTAEEAWKVIKSRSVTESPDISIIVSDKSLGAELDIVVATMYTVVWTEVANYPAIRDLSEIKDAIFNLMQANPKASVLGGSDSLGIYDCPLE